MSPSPFRVMDPDHALSPYTGMARRHWVAAGHWLLDAAFAALPRPDAPMVLPRTETEITYPRPGDPDWRQRVEVFEGIARTLLIAGPLLRHDPGLTLSGVRLADYYAEAILRLAEPGSESYAGDPDEIVREHGDRPYQMTCEFASLALELTLARDVLWERQSRAGRDRIARLMHRWGHARTHPHNWRLFNIHILAFLQREGYAIDQAVLDEHLRVIRSFDAGDGWYRDGTYFDYYSVWAFQFYGPLWAAWSGEETHPAIASAITRSLHKLLETYDHFFDRNGHQPMWGRSNIYRFAATAPFAAAFFLNEPGVAPGLARRVMSGNLLQFVGHPDFLAQGVPALGFYGPFPPLIQPYSCAASPFWFGNAYQGVALPEDHPLWTAQEEAGSWGEVRTDAPAQTHLPGPGIMLGRHATSGATEMRTSKVMVTLQSRMLPNYSRLAFHTQLPWQADTADGLASSQYNLRIGGDARTPNLILHGGERGGVFHRRLLFDFRGGLGNNAAIDLADFAVPYGLVRCDRLRIPEPDAELILGHHALPLGAGEHPVVEERTVGPGLRAWTVAGARHQLALVAVCGWEGFTTREESGLHPDAPASVLPALTSHRPERYAGEPLRICLLLHRNDGQPWTDADLWPFADRAIHRDGAADSDCRVEFTMNNGRMQVVDFTGVEGSLSV